MKRDGLFQLLGIKSFSGEIIKAFRNVRREDFVQSDLQENAYDDVPLPIGHGQTISQPSTIALMLSELDLKKGQKVLEVGSGCGYVMALISEIVGSRGRIFGVDVVSDLIKNSKENLNNYKNTFVYKKNGISGLKEKAPFDRIIVSAALHEVPEELLAQLKNKGILIAPKGSRFEQEIIVIQRISEHEFEIKKKIPGFIFVPFVEEDN